MATTTAAPARWSDEEKVALLLAIIKSNGTTPKWDRIDIPAGRTVKAAQNLYFKMAQASAGVTMVDKDNTPKSRKRGPNKEKSAEDANGKGTKKHGRGANKKKDDMNGGGEEGAENGGTGLTDDEDDEGDRNDHKRVKLENHLGQQPFFGEGEDSFRFDGV